MTREEFKKRWESSEDGGGITFDDIAVVAVDWGISKRPKTIRMEVIAYQVLKEANVNDVEEYNPYRDED